jgi:hypothetical protein
LTTIIKKLKKKWKNEKIKVENFGPRALIGGGPWAILGFRPTRWSDWILAGKSDRFQYFGGKPFFVFFDTKKHRGKESRG